MKKALLLTLFTIAAFAGEHDYCSTNEVVRFVDRVTSTKVYYRTNHQSAVRVRNRTYNDYGVADDHDAAYKAYAFTIYREDGRSISILGSCWDESKEDYNYSVKFTNRVLTRARLMTIDPTKTYLEDTHRKWMYENSKISVYDESGGQFKEVKVKKVLVGLNSARAKFALNYGRLRYLRNPFSYNYHFLADDNKIYKYEDVEFID